MSYDGTLFYGFQKQPNKRTVQGELEKVLSRMHDGAEVRVTGSGRTDAGVHAKGQVIHFDSPLHLPPAAWKKALNAQLPEDIYIHEAESVSDDFHARFSAAEKEYRYFLHTGSEADVFKRNYEYHFPYELDWERINEACRIFEGTHDFTAFSSKKATVKGSKVRTLYEVSFRKNGDSAVFIVRGSGFLYNMVRILVGTLLDIGQGKAEPEEIRTMIAKKDRGNIGKTMPPQGLYLWKVIYEKS